MFIQTYLTYVDVMSTSARYVYELYRIPRLIIHYHNNSVSVSEWVSVRVGG